MKKVLLTTALFFAAFTISAQESVVKEAKKAKSNPEELWLTLLRLMTLQLGNWQVIFRSLSMMMKT